MAQRWAVFLTALCLCVSAASAPLAQTVRLSFPDGSFEVTGPLLGFDGDAYRVDTRFGVLTIAAGTVVCRGDCPLPGSAPVIRLTGSPLMAEVLMPALVDAFARSRGLAALPVDVDDGVGLQLLTGEGEALGIFEIRGPGTAAGFEALRQNQADIVLADRHPIPSEVSALREAGLGDLGGSLRRLLIARQHIRIYAQAADLSLPEFLGRAASDTPAFALTFEASAIEAVLGDLRRLAGVSGEGVALTAVANADAASQAFAQSPRALFLTLQPFSAPEIREIGLATGCTASAPPAAGLRPPFPLTVHFWTYTGEPRLPELARGFLAFASSPEAQRVVDRAGFVDQRLRPAPLAQEGERLSRAVQDLSAEQDLSDLQAALARLEGFERLHFDLRVVPGADALTRESDGLARGLAAHLDTGRYDDRTLLFLGLTGAAGAASRNAATAQRDADIARQAVMGAMSANTSDIDMKSAGLGELFPIACGPTRWARSLNRRVEVWISREP
ncbi:MAG: hypothetical protein AAGF78_12435 [Pseudomonadota bacterium]